MKERLFISHGAPHDGSVDWFIVKQREEAVGLGAVIDSPAAQVARLLRANKTVIELDVEHHQGRVVSVVTVKVHELAVWENKTPSHHCE